MFQQDSHNLQVVAEARLYQRSAPISLRQKEDEQDMILATDAKKLLAVLCNMYHCW